MKLTLMILAVSALLATTGCVIEDQPDHRVRNEGAVGGVDHGEEPGDMDHGDTMQP